MQIKAKLTKLVAGSVLAGTAAALLSGCYVESRRHHHHYNNRPREVVIIKR